MPQKANHLCNWIIVGGHVQLEERATSLHSLIMSSVVMSGDGKEVSGICE